MRDNDAFDFEELRVFGDRLMFSNGIRLIFWKAIRNKRVVMKPTYEEIPEATVYDPITADMGINLSRAAAQELMDTLWTCGVRPTEGSGSAGSLAATEKHLKDLQDMNAWLKKQLEVYFRPTFSTLEERRSDER